MFSFYSKKKILKDIKNIGISNNKKNSKLHSKINSMKGSYNYEKKPYLSILIINFDIIKSHNIHSKIRMINNLLNQSLDNIEILLDFKKTNTIFYKKTIKISRINKQIKIIKSEYDNDIVKLILQSKGKFITVLDKCLQINDSKLYEKIYNKTYGKINNYYEYKIENEVYFLIKNKILKDIIDNEIMSFKNFTEVENYIKLMPHQNLNYISIAFCIDNIYALYSYVSMISILETKNFNTFISFYIIVKKDFSEQNKAIILSLYEQYDFLNISLIYMDDRYNKVKVINYLNQMAYFRLSLGELLPNLNKIIYLDSDVIVYNDLTNLFNTNFNGHMILCRKAPKKMKINEKMKINSGILLLNLKKMRDTKFEQKIIKIINKGFVSSVQDQELLIKYFLNDMGEFNEKYNFPNTGFNSLINYYKKTNSDHKINQLRFISIYPTIKHFNGPKKSSIVMDSFEWWYFASKSKYFSIIKSLF